MSALALKKDFVLEEALDLERHGLSVIPLIADDKKPCVDWKPYQTTRPTSDLVTRWFEGEQRNLGIITGLVSKVVVLDVDNDLGLGSYDKLPDTPTVKTGKGHHYYFKHPGFEVGNFSIPGLGDFRADGGYVVAPPSRHPNGKQYTWLVDFEDAPLAELPEWLLRKAKNYRKLKDALPIAANDNTPETTPYGKKWFEDVEQLARATEGNRNNLLNVVACKAGSLIADGQLSKIEAIKTMLDACKSNGLTKSDGHRQIHKTIASGLQAGAKNPRGPVASVEAEPPRKGGLKFKWLADIQSEKVDWLWDGVLAKGAISILAGEPGVGKSTISLGIAAIVSNGGRWPVSGDKAEQGKVIVVSMEDVPAYTTAPRLEACGADPRNVCIIEDDVPFSLARDIGRLRELVETLGDVKLIIVDPVTAHLGKADNNSVGDVRNITTQLSQLAQDFRLSVLLVQHLNKNDKASPLDRLAGSGAWGAAARTAFLVSSNANDKELLSMTTLKNNIAPSKTSYGCRIRSKTLAKDIKTSFVEWENYTSNLSPEQVLAEKRDGGKISLAIGFVRDLLESGPMEVSDLEREANENGISEITLKRARKHLGAKPSKVGLKWIIELPKAA